MAMSTDKIKEVIETLRAMTKEIDIRDMPGSAVFSNHDFRSFRQHLLTMPDRMLVMLDEGRREKVMRWLGFMQGALWVAGVSLEELKRMNMPNEGYCASCKHHVSFHVESRCRGADRAPDCECTRFVPQ